MADTSSAKRPPTHQRPTALAFSPSTVAPPGAPPPFPLEHPIEAVPWAVLALLLSGLFAFLRTSLQTAHTPRVLEGAGSERRKARLATLLEDAERLMTSAAILQIAFDLLFLSLLLAAVGDSTRASWTDMLLALSIAVPLMLSVSEYLPAAFAHRFGERFLAAALPFFFWCLLPLRVLVLALESTRRAIMRLMKVPEENPSARQIVAGLRDVIDSSGRDSDLDETERELMHNLMDFREVDVAAVMTPRTEVDGIEIEGGLEGAVTVCAEKGHSRIPVYEGSLDQILGYVSARGLVQMYKSGELPNSELRRHLQPVKFVPETKLVSELLAEFRRERQKLAIVVDEYGGTAGIVTLGDVLEEIVGEIQDEFDPEEPEALRKLEPGVAEVEAGVHVTEVNEELGLLLPEEEDFETLGGYVLAQLGHLPKIGENFERDGVEFEVLEASDRRVLSVRIRMPAQRVASGK